MGCMCCSLASFVSIVLHSLERISLCTVCAMLTCCLLFTIMSVLMLGIGIGYHYCFVQNSVDAMAKAAKAAGSMRSGPQNTGPVGGGVLRSLDKVAGRGFAHRVARRDADRDPPLTNNVTDISNRTPSPTGVTNITPDPPRSDQNTKSISGVQSFANPAKHRIVRRQANPFPPIFTQNIEDSLMTNISTPNVTNSTLHQVSLEANPFPPYPNQIDVSIKNMTNFTDSLEGPYLIPSLTDQNTTIISFNKIILNITVSNLTVSA